VDVERALVRGGAPAEDLAVELVARTTVPASRSNRSRIANSVLVTATASPPRRTWRVAGSSSTSPTTTAPAVAPVPPWPRRSTARMRAASSRGLNGLGR